MQLAASNNPPETLTDFFPEQILGGTLHFVRILLPHPGYQMCADDKFLHQALLVFRVSVSAAFFKEAVHGINASHQTDDASPLLIPTRSDSLSEIPPLGSPFESCL